MSTSRREFLASSATAALLGAFGRTALAQSLLQEPQPVFTPLRRNAGFFTMRGGTIGWLVNDGGVVVVDSQYPAEGKACLDGLNARSGNRAVDFLINTHHHGDHTGGNVSFRGAAKKVVAHAQAAEHMHNPPGMQPTPGGQPGAGQLYPDTTFTEQWTADVGDERIRARHYGRAHTSGDAVITFERANVVHMGDLVFYQRHPVVDRAAGATIRNWISVLDRTMADHAPDTLYIFGHAKAGMPVSGGPAELTLFRDYLAALIGFVEAQLRAGRSREEILAMRDPLKGFESFGPFGQAGPREALTCAVEEVMAL